jgi:hypothetical protein
MERSAAGGRDARSVIEGRSAPSKEGVRGRAVALGRRVGDPPVLGRRVGDPRPAEPCTTMHCGRLRYTLK